ncbi:MAG: hypothetical protein MJ250_02575 [Alphaproteobacteria bacterium]|nr:hypothetical protein [Alphaproteobacteria bacterium]
MMCSFKVQRGKIIDIRYDGGSFYCDKKELITLKGCPKKIEYDFNCSDNKLTTLKG